MLAWCVNSNTLQHFNVAMIKLTTSREEIMKLSALIAAVFAAVSFSAVASDAKPAEKKAEAKPAAEKKAEAKPAAEKKAEPKKEEAKK